MNIESTSDIGGALPDVSLGWRHTWM